MNKPHGTNRLSGVFIILFAVAVALSGCGMNKNGSNCCVSTLSGTAAGGAPIANATIQIKDKTGKIASATTDANGNYSIEVSGMSSPFIIKVTKGAITFYGISNADGVANVHQFTDLMVRTWYKFKGTTADAIFAAAGSIQVPTAIQIAAMEAAVRALIADWLEEHGVAPALFNLITTPFNANSTYFDLTLDLIKVNIAGGTVHITPIDPASGNATGDDLAAIPDNTDLSTNPVLTAVFEINTTLNNFRTTVNANSGTLAASHIAQYYDPAFLSNGSNGATEEANVAAYLQTGNITYWIVKHVVAYDPVNSIMAVRTMGTYTDGTGLTHTNEVVGIDVFKKDVISGNWRLYGNQRIAMLDVTSGVKRSIGLSLTSTYTNIMPIVAVAPTGAVTSISVTGPTLNPNPTTLSSQIPFSGDPTKDLFYIPNDNPIGATQPGPGALYTFTLTKADLSTVTYKQMLPAGSGSILDANTLIMTSPTGHALANANIGTALNPSWTLPLTILVNKVELSGWVADGTNFCGVTGTVNANMTSGTITLPATCGGATTAGAVVVKAIGWGKRIAVLEYRFGI